jgi:hypothetical protein
MVVEMAVHAADRCLIPCRQSGGGGWWSRVVAIIKGVWLEWWVVVWWSTGDGLPPLGITSGDPGTERGL